MVFTLAKAAALVALLCPIITALPSTGALKPRVAWKEKGISDHQKRQNGYPTNGGCTHGPSSRNCWHGDYNIDTDMDDHWPNTGKVVKVFSSTPIFHVLQADIFSFTLTSQTPQWRRMVSPDPSWW
jgi:hypothetical protein